MEVNFYTNEFKEKCESKKLNPIDFHNKLQQRLPQYKGRWEKSMADQIQHLPNFDQVVREITRQIKKLKL